MVDIVVQIVDTLNVVQQPVLTDVTLTVRLVVIMVVTLIRDLLMVVERVEPHVRMVDVMIKHVKMLVDLVIVDIVHVMGWPLVVFILHIL